MSIQLMSRVWDLNLQPNRLILLLKMADHAQDDGSRIYPSIQHLQLKTKLSKRTIQRVLGEFIDAEILVVVRPGGGKGRTTRYRLDIDRAEKLYPMPLIDEDEKGAADASFVGSNSDTLTPNDRENSATVARLEDRNSESHASKGATENTKGATAWHRTLQEPSENHSAHHQAQATWDSSLDDLTTAKALDERERKAWLDVLTPHIETPEILFLKSPSRFFKEHVETNYLEIIEENTGKKISIGIGFVNQPSAQSDD